MTDHFILDANNTGETRDMVDLNVIIPSRGRPGNVVELWKEFHATAQGNTTLSVFVDNDDPRLQEYQADQQRFSRAYELIVWPSGKGGIGEIVNRAGRRAAWKSRAVGFMGDDHRPRTEGWDVKMLAALDALPGPGVVYGQDGGIGDTLDLPTAAILDSHIIKALGYMVPPALVHMYFDNFWRDFGLRLGSIAHLDDVLIEHMHPSVGKSQWDETYRATNMTTRMEEDRAAYDNYVRFQMDVDLERVRLHG